MRVRHGAERTAIRTLAWTERGVFFIIGILLFMASLVLLARAVPLVLDMAIGSGGSPISYGTNFLDLILLVLMVVELAYTIILSLRGAVLSAEPFLIVGLIAVIRRILVITVGDVKGSGVSGTLSVQSATELGILTAVVLTFVISIAVLRSRPRSENFENIEDDI